MGQDTFDFCSFSGAGVKRTLANAPWLDKPRWQQTTDKPPRRRGGTHERAGFLNRPADADPE